MKLQAEITSSKQRKKERLVLRCLSCPGWPQYEGEEAHLKMAEHYRIKHPSARKASA